MKINKILRHFNRTKKGGFSMENMIKHISTVQKMVVLPWFTIHGHVFYPTSVLDFGAFTSDNVGIKEC